MRTPKFPPRLFPLRRYFLALSVLFILISPPSHATSKSNFSQKKLESLLQESRNEQNRCSRLYDEAVLLIAQPSGPGASPEQRPDQGGAYPSKFVALQVLNKLKEFPSRTSPGQLALGQLLHGKSGTLDLSVASSLGDCAVTERYPLIHQLMKDAGRLGFSFTEREELKKVTLSFLKSQVAAPLPLVPLLIVFSLSRQCLESKLVDETTPNVKLLLNLENRSASIEKEALAQQAKWPAHLAQNRHVSSLSKEDKVFLVRASLAQIARTEAIRKSLATILNRWK